MLYNPKQTNTTIQGNIAQNNGQNNVAFKWRNHEEK